MQAFILVIVGFISNFCCEGINRCSQSMSSYLTSKGLERPKRVFSILDRFPKLQNSSNGFKILYNRVLPCHLLNKTNLTQNKFIVTDL